MSAENEAVVRRFYEEMANDRKNDLAEDLFTTGYVLHDPQIPGGKGPKGMADVVKTYQDGVEGHWDVKDIFSSGDRVAVRWQGSGKHVGEVNGIPATGKKVGPVDAISIFRLEKGKIAEMWEVWDTLGFLQQLGVIPKQ